MLSRFVLLLLGSLVGGLSSAGSVVLAQNQNPINAFFGFDFVLQPLAIKWACGGTRDQDLSRIGTLIAAFPEDAERAELGPTVAVLSKMASGLESLPQVLGAELSEPRIEQLCAAALPPNIEWVTPEQFILGDESGIPDEQEAAWSNFFRIVEGFQ